MSISSSDSRPKSSFHMVRFHIFMDKHQLVSDHSCSKVGVRLKVLGKKVTAQSGCKGTNTHTDTHTLFDSTLILRLALSILFSLSRPSPTHTHEPCLCRVDTEMFQFRFECPPTPTPLLADIVRWINELIHLLLDRNRQPGSLFACFRGNTRL